MGLEIFENTYLDNIDLDDEHLKSTLMPIIDELPEFRVLSKIEENSGVSLDDIEYPFGSKILALSINKLKKNPQSTIAWDTILRYRDHGDFSSPDGIKISLNFGSDSRSGVDPTSGIKWEGDYNPTTWYKNPTTLIRSYYREFKDMSFPEGIAYVKSLVKDDPVFSDIMGLDYSEIEDKDDKSLGDRVKDRLNEVGAFSVDDKDILVNRDIPKGDLAEKGKGDVNNKPLKTGLSHDSSALNSLVKFNPKDFGVVKEALKIGGNYVKSAAESAVTPKTPEEINESATKSQENLIESTPIIGKTLAKFLKTSRKFSQPMRFSEMRSPDFSEESKGPKTVSKVLSALSMVSKNTGKWAFNTAVNVTLPNFNPDPRKLSSLELLASGYEPNDFSDGDTYVKPEYVPKVYSGPSQRQPSVKTFEDTIRDMYIDQFMRPKMTLSNIITDLTGIGATPTNPGTFKNLSIGGTLQLGKSKINLGYQKVNPYNTASATLSVQYPKESGNEKGKEDNGVKGKDINKVNGNGKINTGKFVNLCKLLSDSDITARKWGTSGSDYFFTSNMPIIGNNKKSFNGGTKESDYTELINQLTSNPNNTKLKNDRGKLKFDISGDTDVWKIIKSCNGSLDKDDF